MLTRPMHILIAEDNPGDVKLIEIALREQSIETEITTCSDGYVFLELIEGLASSAESHLPDLVLLDLNLPKKDGFEVLEMLKKDERFAHIPVVIFSSSREPKDVARIYSLGGSAYINKSLDFSEFSNSIQEVVRFWGQVALLPEYARGEML